MFPVAVKWWFMPPSVTMKVFPRIRFTSTTRVT
jgi:hypothetical protein